jgi:DNA-directed RNA polymerase subunit K/omega
MSDYEDDDDDQSYDYNSESEQEVDDEEAFLGHEANGHNLLKDEEEENEVKAEEELYGEVEPVEPEDDGAKLMDEDYEEEVEIPDEKPETKFGKVSKDKRKTSKMMTKYEFSYLVSQRALAIEHGSPLMFPETKFIHAIDISKEETFKGINPIIIQRVIPILGGEIIEEWKCSELIIPFAYSEEGYDFIKHFKK